MARFGLIGCPISHSKSPALFRAAYPDLDDTYELVEATDLEESIALFLEGDFKGINVTSPYKDAVMEYVSIPDRVSSLLGSANVLLKGEGKNSGKYDIYSYNTDYYGVKNTILEMEKDCSSVWNKRKNPIENILVVGAGGAGKAAALAMRDLGYKVYLANRSAGKIAEFTSVIGAEYVPLERVAEFADKSDVIIYSLSFLVEGLKDADLSDKIIFEANYARPVFSPECGIKTALYISGRKWLYNQAVPAFELFVGKKPNLLKMKEIIGVE